MIDVVVVENSLEKRLFHRLFVLLLVLGSWFLLTFEPWPYKVEESAFQILDVTRLGDDATQGFRRHCLVDDDHPSSPGRRYRDHR